MKNKECARFWKIIRRMTGWTFADIFYHYFGNSSLILSGEGSNGEDLEFSINENWLKENHLLNFANREETLRAYKHVKNCSNAKCKEAKRRMDMIITILNKGLPEAVALVSVLYGKVFGKGRCLIGREDGFGGSIDQVKPFFLWFIDEKEFWEWPKE